MTMTTIQALSVAIIGAALLLLVKQHGRHILLAYVSLAVAGWVGEETCIRFYDFYHYSNEWWLRLDRVPLLITLIWPLVILSARDVARALGASSPRGMAIAVFAIVVVDASMVEIIAVARGMWSWAEPGYLHVPILGILGWGFFAASAVMWLAWCESKAWRWQLLAVVIGPVAAHALIIAAWWSCFRWTLRGALTPPVWIMLVPAAIVVAWLVMSKRVGVVGITIQLPRMVAAGLFFAIVATLPSALLPALLFHTAAVAVMYLVATKYIVKRA
jgi:hypothetical protein